MAILTYGIDVSENNGKIDWNLVKASTNPKVEYAYIKVTEGASRIDSLAVNNAASAQQVKIPIGYYHYAYMNGTNPVKDATDEANFFLSRLKYLPKATQIPMLDIEENPGHFAPAQVQQWIQTFLDVMKANGYPKVTLYSYAPWFNQNLPANHPFGKIPLWIAAYVNLIYPTLPVGWNSYTLWQFTGKGKVPGIAGDVDINKTTPDLLKLLKVGGISLAGIAITFGLFFLGYKVITRKKKTKEK